MKRLLFILICLAVAARAQLPPAIQFQLQSNGDLNLSWAVQSVNPLTPELLPTYEVQFANALETNSWQAGSVVGPVNFSNGRATILLPELGAPPATFFKLRALLDFKGATFPVRDFSNTTLSNADFSGANLFRTILDDANLRNATLMAADLRSASLDHADLSGADLTLARLADANCAGADFTGANLRFAELSGADLSFASLDHADLRGAVIESVTNAFTRFHGSQIDELTVMSPNILAVWQMVNNQAAGKTFGQGDPFPPLDLSFSDLSGANLTNVTLLVVSLLGSDLQGADLSGANVLQANFHMVDFRRAVLDANTKISSKFRLFWDITNHPQTNRNLVAVDLTQGLWIGAVFDHANLAGAKFSNGLMSDVNLNGAIATAANFTGVEFHGGDLRNANFQNANFINARFDGANFTGANTNGANFIGALFHNTTMPNGSIRNN